MMLRRIWLTGFITAFFGMQAYAGSADIYKYTDGNGVIHFSNVNVASGMKCKKASPSVTRTEVPKTVASTPSATEPAKESPQRVVETSYSELIKSACLRHGVDPALVNALVKVESDFNPFALSKKGAMGLMQLMPQTAVNWSVKNTYSPHENVDGGVRYLRYLLDRYEGNLTLALAAYNAGETAVQKWGTIPPFPETQQYVSKILKLYNGTGISRSPRFTIYVGYADDGALVFTDDPSKHAGIKMSRKKSRDL
jgi:soluble lytic murein transglycosylase-like protein